MEDINYPLILVSALAAISSPGPATLAIASASMSSGRIYGLTLACGVLTGSLFWSCSAAFGLAALLNSNIWLLEFMRYCGAAYLIYLSLKSLRSAFGTSTLTLSQSHSATLSNIYFKGLLIHLANPKAILFFISLFSIGVPATAKTSDLISVILSVGLLSSSVFLGYALLFSNHRARYIYLKSKVIFECTFAAFFGFAGIKILTAGIVK
ncbi:LysE family translocator [Shewanella sp. FJAT-51649]|uniref:LysE family translocator n=1 Tax=Shewanella sp. FJAT-51649 TaxID=2864210 RepID=UPI001C655D50|nr:LysE family translocator [Shewanella sp. FJAT-51649]QYJ71327.1 LysE family translocator [Shewanella sp. FJAT-51649]